MYKNISSKNGRINNSGSDKCITFQKIPVVLIIILFKKIYHWHAHSSTKDDLIISIPSEY